MSSYKKVTWTGALRQLFICRRPAPSLLHTVRIHVPLTIFTQGRGGEGVDEPVRRLDGRWFTRGSKIPT